MYRVVWKKLLEFSVKLSGQCFIVTQDQCWFLNLLHNVCNGKSFPGARHPKKHLAGIPALNSFNELLYGFGLITGWLEFRSEIKFQWLMVLWYFDDGSSYWIVVR